MEKNEAEYGNPLADNDISLRDKSFFLTTIWTKLN